ncbi:hypothetical protein TcYC6_0077070 [Trypanosoma cruzi]|uniref:Uncharacterized protein n=1 Tax=Trypanosoma cruzi (strain CL Brener) TaxID=353153 RepID=Q4CS21_TRYCC|nr:hypothetical protein Tc00.1047053508765.40 [Trypanosoma cruzi]EAN83074.1 hypothetical protein Tc00.1047053508765.40 [Trypanosoma cruzi]KAF8298069.1 hypothetical protein TcYC6_0077070 [Trypanosoma cruzi]|eukprot:XP_804925.1 hypothetical protein [Trypanosoma cruzi strain CL Brener]
MGSNEELNGARRMGSQRKTEQQRQQQFSANGLLTSEALARENLGSELSRGKEEAVKIELQTLVERNPSPAAAAAAATATNAAEACSATPAGGGGVLHGQWRELRQREMGGNDAGR